ncbi:MAG: carbamoyltransferase [Planctomycetes bacterium]|nr:carbamoyltransferase [Planctomycetota bacterium]
MNILGISAFYHDSAASLVQDGEIIAAVQEERFTRKKHDHNFPVNSVNYCLKAAGLTMNDINYVAFYEKPFLKFERILETYMQFAPLGIRSFIKSMPLWIKQKLWMKEYIKKELNYSRVIVFTEHHESHAASAFFPSPFREAAILTMDGVGEWTTTSFGLGKDNVMNLIAELKFPHSLGLLYSAFTYFTGFKVNSAEYKVMGLAPYGEPKYKDVILSELIDLKDDGSFRMNMKYFNYCTGLKMTNSRFERLFGGPPRQPEAKITQREMDLARSIQEVTEEVVVRIAKHVRKDTGQNKLCLAGGVALNCVANGKLFKEKIFDDIWIQPAAGDAGGSLGAALFVWYQYLDNKRITDETSDSMYGALLGPDFSKGEILQFLNKNQIPFIELTDTELPKKVADLIAQEKVIGFFQGRMEFGPRALGARSIIGDARSPIMQETMNLKIKFRESFRPFAPSVLKEKASDYFELDKESPYMLLVADVKKEHRKHQVNNEAAGFDKLKVVRSSIPAVTHVDYSARIQTVEKDTNPVFYEVISQLEKNYGCAVVINTSYNVRGEPIICTPADAYRCFMRTNIDYLVLGDFLLDKGCQKPIERDADWKKEFDLD